MMNRKDYNKYTAISVSPAGSGVLIQLIDVDAGGDI